MDTKTDTTAAFDMEKMAEALIREAIRAIDGSHPANPWNRRFGCALQTSSGRVFASSAFWSDTLSLTLHAEHAALAHAAAHNDRQVVAIASVSTEDQSGDAYCHPCGICKQLIYENSLSSGIDILVLMANFKGKFFARHISELDLFPWPARHAV
jgi:cytidine deaminase